MSLVKGSKAPHFRRSAIQGRNRGNAFKYRQINPSHPVQVDLQLVIGSLTVASKSKSSTIHQGKARLRVIAPTAIRVDRAEIAQKRREANHVG
jgi:hypothetical protein